MREVIVTHHPIDDLEPAGGITPQDVCLLVACIDNQSVADVVARYYLRSLTGEPLPSFSAMAREAGVSRKVFAASVARASLAVFGDRNPLA